MVKVFIAPKTRNVDATGGIARVIEAQNQWLPECGIELVDLPQYADVLAVHAATWEEPLSTQHVVSHCHGLYWAQDDWPAKWYDDINKQVIEAIRMSDKVTCPSEWVADALRRGGLIEPVVIGHGINIEDWQPSQENGYVLWDKARQDKVCDPRPVNILASAMSNVRFVSTFGEEAKNVRITGEMPHREHKELMSHAAVYLATARETGGISILEALACGVPVVGWNWGGQAEIVTKDVGWLSTPGDYDALATSIRYCMEHRKEMSIAARQLVEDKYQWKHIMRQYADLYTSLAIHTTTPKVTVIIPSYNLSKYLPDAIESVLKQDYTNYEVVVVDDCSTDDSYNLAKTYEQKDKRVRVYKTKRNMNMPGVLNLGLAMSSGEYVMNLDADNMLAPGILRTLVQALDDDRSLDIVYGKLKFVLDDGVTVDKQVSPDGISGWPPQMALYEQQMAHRNQIPSTALTRRRLVNQIGGYRHRCFRIGEDPDFWCRALSIGAHAVRITDAVMLLYRMRETSRSHVQPEWSWESWYPNKPIQIGGPINIVEPKISIIIPVGPGHGTQGIEDALDSVYAQSMHEWECIVVDDTLDEIRWLPSWVQRYSTKRRGAGTSVARNIGLEHARGQAVVFLDADDYLDSDYLIKMYKVFAQRRDTYVYCDAYANNDKIINIEKHDAVDVLNNLRHPITCMFPNDSRIKFDETMQVGEDWDYVLNVLSHRICGIHVAEPLVYYRTVSGNNRRGLLQSAAQIRKELNDRYKEKIMACGCKANAALPVLDKSNTQAVQQAAMSGDLVLLEFVKPGTSTLTWTGKATGQNYRFGSDSGHRIGYVHKADALEFLKRPEFALATSG